MAFVVLDTSVLVAAVRSRGGASFQLLSRIGTGVFDIAVSVPLVLEYEDALMRHLSAAALNKGMFKTSSITSAALRFGTRFSICGGRTCEIRAMIWCSNWRLRRTATRSLHTTFATSQA